MCLQRPGFCAGTPGSRCWRENTGRRRQAQRVSLRGDRAKAPPPALQEAHSVCRDVDIVTPRNIMQPVTFILKTMENATGGEIT